MSRKDRSQTRPPVARPVAQRVRQAIARLTGDPIEFNLRRLEDAVARIDALETEVSRLSACEIEQRARGLRAAMVAGLPRHEAREMAFALAREAARRHLGQRPFDVQLLAAVALDEGSLVEMQTGEGKTLAAVMPASLNAFTGRGVHVLTFNDYLARRDAAWMGPVYRALGLSVGIVEQGMPPAARRQAYAADVTYVTAREAGFDHLRDMLATEAAGLVHRPLHFALVDEADSLLVDEARAPLVIAGRVERDASSAGRLAALVASLVPGTHFDTDEYARDVELTESGIEAVEKRLHCGSLHAPENYELLTGLNCALHARVLLRRDVDYIVRNGRVEIVDEFTGRVVHDRHWPDGLHAAVEAKEGLESRPDGQVLGSMTLQHFLGGYPRLCGMTGTARDAAWEVQQQYGLRTVVVPTNRPMVRVDHPDVVFTHGEAKERAVVEEIRRMHATGRPVLVGTLSVEESEGLAARLREVGVECQVLNARNDAAEAAVIAGAGAPGAVTISTNMAGRGTDIRLGGPDETQREQVARLGGLYVLGTSHHESRRVDLQLCGRAGRQGDPGESRFFISLEDSLLVRYGIGDLIPRPIMPAPSDTPIDHPVICREVARAQRIIEGQNLEIRRTLWRYAQMVEEQRRRIMARRQALLEEREVPDTWSRRPERRTRLVQVAGEAAVRRAERAVTLFHIDRAWRDHLALIADVREGIHLVALGGGDPLTRFSSEIIDAFEQMQQAIDGRVLEALEAAANNPDAAPLPGAGLKGPSSTWTYIVNDDAFRKQIGMLLTGPGRTTVAIYAAMTMMPLLIVWGLVGRFLGRRPRRRPFGG